MSSKSERERKEKKIQNFIALIIGRERYILFMSLTTREIMKSK